MQALLYNRYLFEQIQVKHGVQHGFPNDDSFVEPTKIAWFGNAVGWSDPGGLPQVA